jgi:calcineurin-like phosphoesterase family protein
MPLTHIISDTHFGHHNILGYCNRPFNDVGHMTEELIKRWNSIVKNGDLVYHLGDFGFTNAHDTREIVSRLNGDIYFIKGNHDRLGSGFYKDVFYQYSQHPIIVENFYILSHKPMFVNENMPYVNIHGHLHNTPDVHPEFVINPRYFNASVECINYTPMNFDTIKKHFTGELYEQSCDS